jgi:transitional endoplasmic reticulum ATPase
LGEGVDLRVLAHESEGFTGADISAVCEEAKMLAIREYITGSGGKCNPAPKKVNPRGCKVERKHFEAALEHLKAREASRNQ